MDFLAGLFELFGNWNVGNKKRFGFLLNIIGCSIWIYVSIHSHVYGLLIVVIPAIFINIRNWFRWKNKKKQSSKKKG